MGSFAVRQNGTLSADGELKPGFRWYVVQCQTHRERLAASNLKNQRYGVFLPLREKTRRHARRIETVLRPYFPGYLFVGFDAGITAWRPINGTVGVARLVTNRERPTAAPPGIIEALIERCNDSDILEWHPALKPGDRIRVAAGPFSDLIGRLDALDGASRVRVLLNLLGGHIPVWLPRASVVPAESLA